ncbi:MAG: hypothetical protein Q8R57_07875 [Bacteroidota bacterium]|nr:hypothetical protein [Bacteroidota bacterium]
MGSKLLLGVLAFVLFSACGQSGEEYYPTPEKYAQVVKFADTNMLIQSISYNNGELIDTPNARVATLKLSYYRPTKFTVFNAVAHYDFEIWIKFASSNIENENGKNYYRKIEAIYLTHSTAINARFVRNRFYSNQAVWNIDSLIIQ